MITNDQLLKIVSGALKCCINDHGPITKQWTGSAAKRVVNQLVAILDDRGHEKIVIVRRDNKTINDLRKKNKRLRTILNNLVEERSNNGRR